MLDITHKRVKQFTYQRFYILYADCIRMFHPVCIHAQHRGRKYFCYCIIVFYIIFIRIPFLEIVFFAYFHFLINLRFGYFTGRAYIMGIEPQNTSCVHQLIANLQQLFLTIIFRFCHSIVFEF